MLEETFSRGDAANRAGGPVPLRRDDPDRLLQAMVAGCAMVACADGQVSRAERNGLHLLVSNDPLLSLYPPQAVAVAFARHERAFAGDEHGAFLDAMRLIGLVSDRTDHARRVLRACLIMTGVDGGTHPGEIAAVDAVRAALGLGARGGCAESITLPVAGAMLAGDTAAASTVPVDRTLDAPGADPDGPAVYSGPVPDSLRALHDTIVRSAHLRVLSRRLNRPTTGRARHTPRRPSA